MRPGRTIVSFIAVWHGLVIVFGHTQSAFVGLGLMVVVGAVQSFSMVTMSVLLLSITDPSYRGRVGGVRMLAVYGLPMGLLAGGALIERIGITATFNLFGLVGIMGTCLIVARWPKIMQA